MKKIIGILLGLACAANAAMEIRVAGPASGYAETGVQSWRSTNAPKSFDADGDNVYGSAGLFFIGKTGSARPDFDAKFANFTKVGAPWADVSPGADASYYCTPTAAWDYADIDDPDVAPGVEVADWSIQSGWVRNSGAGSVGDWDELLKFTVDPGAPKKFRVGVMAANMDNRSYHPSALRLSEAGGSSVTVSGLATTARSTGMVFFDIDLNGETSGTFSILAQRSTAQGAGLAGVTFDVISATASAASAAKVPALNFLTQIDWPAFMARQDMVWSKVPTRWNEAPFMGNGMIGLFLYQEISNPDNTYSTAEKNVLSLHLGRGDYYDNRPPLDGKPHTWIYRGRLPIGFFRIKSKGDVTGVDWRMDLWNARLVGTVKTTAGSYRMEGKVHALYDSFYWKVIPAGGESVGFEWQPQKATSYARMVSEKAVERGKLNGGEVSHFYTTFAGMPYPEAPEVEITESAAGNTSRQVLYENSGELVTAWKTIDDPSDRSTTLLASIAFSKELGVSMPTAQKDLARSLAEVERGTYTQTHEQWWHDYYPRSFVSVSDDFWEQFYWIQMYKLASASRADGMMIDTAGPWYQPGFHPLVWTDLNVQLDYWAQLTANRLEVGKSLMNGMERNIQNLIHNVPADWRNDCLNADTVFPGDDLIAPTYKKVADHIVWMLHNYWLFCRYGNDTERMRDGLFPLLKRANATYLRYLQENPLDLGDGQLHFKSTWSPESATGVDMNYTIGLARWSCKTLLAINEAHHLNDPKAAEWQHLLDNLVDYQKDENGLRTGRDFPFEHAHRHYSHLLGFYPLFDLNPDTDRDLLQKSVDHWLKVTEDPGKVVGQAMPVTGYTCTGAASMYAALGDGNKAFEYLRKFTFVNIYANTLYAEGKEQLIETPLSAASAMNDMLLQSWGGRIRILPGVPDAWKDIHFESLLGEGGVVVSADRTQGKLNYAKIESPDEPRTIEFSVPMAAPEFFLIDASQKKQRLRLQKKVEGFYPVNLPANGALEMVADGVVPADITPVKSSARLKNIFGHNGQYETVRAQFKMESFRDPIGVTK
jgi:hypothetical protein